MLAENYPIEYENQVENQFNGKTGPKVDFVDVGCGYGGLLCI